MADDAKIIIMEVEWGDRRASVSLPDTASTEKVKVSGDFLCEVAKGWEVH